MVNALPREEYFGILAINSLVLASGLKLVRFVSSKTEFTIRRLTDLPPRYSNKSGGQPIKNPSLRTLRFCPVN
jgi:hypothetical protein